MPTMYFVQDIALNGQNELLTLENQIITVDDKGLSQNLVSSVVIRDNECKIAPLYRWNDSHVSVGFNGDRVLRSDYEILDIEGNELYNLLENSEIALPHKYAALSRIYYPEYHFLQVINSQDNIFIDCRKRKIIARYSNDHHGIFKGFCSGSEFWMGKQDGVYSVPFPLIEEDEKR